MRATVFIDSRRATVGIGNAAAVVGLDSSRALVTCSQIEEATFTTPTLVSWSALAQDNGSSGADVHFVTSVTAGSPCRIGFKLVKAGTNDPRTGYSSPDQLTPHACSVDGITAAGDRGQTYDLYWRWTSGNQSAGYALVASAAIYIPNNGEGDFPASG
jgi:hypothetical protein